MRAVFLFLIPLVALSQDPAPTGQTTVEKPAGSVSTRPPRKGAFAPGELPEDAKKKKFDELNGKTKKDAKAAAKAASAKRREWLDGLEKQFGIYDVTTIADNGDSAKRVDVVILTAGFPKSDAAKINQMAESLKVGLLKVDPFRNYPLYINFHRVSVNDASAGASKIPFRVANQILTCDIRKALEYAEHAPAADLVVVLCNTPPCRATAAGPVITIDASLDMGRTFLHEMGHAFGRLMDEYIEPGNEKLNRPSPFTPEQEESIINVTMNLNAKLSKWHYWLPDVWNAPHAPNRLPPQHKVGCFEGAGLFGLGNYRPEESCLMRTGDHYCVVCFEQVETQFYRLIAPIDDARPRRSKLGLWIDETMTFEGDAIQTFGGGKSIGEFRGLWYVDHKNHRPSQAKNLTTSLAIQAQELGEGPHEVALRVDFSNIRVRRDHGWLSSARAWSVDVVKHRKPKFEGPAEAKAQVGKPVEFEMKIANPDPAKFRIEAVDLPEGATFVGEKFSWTPTKAHQGAWRPRFILTDGLRSVTKGVEIAVLDPAEKGSYKPLFLLMDPVAVNAGETLELALDVVDVDGDNLVFSCANLPDGAELDPYQGVIKWKPATSQVGRYPGIALDVWDGIYRAKGSVEIVVDENPALRRDTSNLAAQLRSPQTQARATAVKKLGSSGKSFQFMEAARLLRDRFATVRAAALGVLQPLAESADEALLGMMVKDLAPHAWSFTDDPDILAWLASLVAKGKGERSDLDALRGALKAIEKYNRDRGAAK
jgi:hypothetical protein